MPQAERGTRSWMRMVITCGVPHARGYWARTQEASMAKTASFAAVHFTVAFCVGTLLTGNPLVGGLLAIVEPACNTVAYHLHEKFWKRREQRRLHNDEPRETAPGTGTEPSLQAAV